MLLEKWKDTYKTNKKILDSKSSKLCGHTKTPFRGNSTQLALADYKTIKNSITDRTRTNLITGWKYKVTELLRPPKLEEKKEYMEWSI